MINSYSTGGIFSLFLQIGRISANNFDILYCYKTGQEKIGVAEVAEIIDRLPPEELLIFFPPSRQPFGVMERWSNGVMKALIQVEIWAFAFSNTPILQYSKTARNLYRQNHRTLTSR
jgi:hypothetical protein